MILHKLASAIRRQDWFQVVVEVLIVIVGIFLGLQVTEWNEGRQDKERAEALLEAVHAELGDFNTVTGKIVNGFSEGLTAFEAARARGEIVPPFVMRFPGSDTPPTTTWDAAQQSGIAALIHPSLLFDLGYYYSEIEGVGAKLVRYSEFVDNEVMPLLDDPASFYDAEGNLKGAFAQNIERLREWTDYNKALMESAKCLQKRIETPSEPGERCAPIY